MFLDKNLQLVFSISRNIQILNTGNGTLKEIVGDQQLVNSMDIDVRRRLLFWTDYSDNITRRYRSILFTIFNACPFDSTTIAGSGKVGPINRLTTPVR